MVSSKDVRKSAVGVIRKLFLGVCVAVFLFSAVFLVNTYVIEPYKNNQAQSGGDVDEDDTQTAQIEHDGVAVQSKYVDLLKTNSEFVGKLRIAAIQDKGFNVTQTTDNSKYTNTDFNGRTNRYGTLFVDYRNGIKEFDTNTIIYGHNMRDGAQFGNLDYYTDIETYRDYPIVQFNTIYQNHTWKIFAAFLINSQAESDNGYIFPYLTTNFPSDEKFTEFIDDVKTRSYFINETVDVKPDDKILTLSTCDSTFDDARFVVMARLLRDGESPEVDTEAAVKNKNQRFPQAWYDRFDEENPFRNEKNYTLS